MTSPVAVIGAGLVGAGWAIVFSRAGYPVRLYDGDACIRERALVGIRANLDDLLGALKRLGDLCGRFAARRYSDTRAEYSSRSRLERRMIRAATLIDAVC